MFTTKMQRIPVTDEAKVFYLSNCLVQGDYIEAQQDNGVDPPKIRVDYGYAEQYYRINDLDQEDIDSIIEELREIGLIDDDLINYSSPFCNGLLLELTQRGLPQGCPPPPPSYSVYTPLLDSGKKIFKGEVMY